MTRLGDLERAVMDVLWDRSGPATVREVVDGLDGRDLAYTTVMTVLDRLAGKGMVERERAGRAWSYRRSPAATRTSRSSCSTPSTWPASATRRWCGSPGR